MAYRTHFSQSELERIWQLRNEGIRMAYIADDIQRPRSSLLRMMHRTGGISPYVCKRSDRHLSLEEREVIMLGVVQGKSKRQIAREINRAPSTVTREIKRNAPLPCHNYQASIAERNAYRRAKRPKACKLDMNPKLKQFVEDGLNQKWSPEEISIRLALHYKDDPEMRISHETIYQALYIQSRGTLKSELKKQLRRKNPYRKSKLLKKTYLWEH